MADNFCLYISPSGSVTLTQNQIAYGSPSNTITSSNKVTYDPSIGIFSVKDAAGSSMLIANASIFDYVFGDRDGVNNHTYLQIQDLINLVTINGNNGGATTIPTAPSVNFSGSGLNDMTNTTVTFTGTAPITYTITINSTGGTDTYDWTDGTTTVTNVSISGGSSIPLNHGVEITFANKSGHTVGDIWSFSYANAMYGQMLSLDGQNQVYAIGDVSEIANGGNFTLSNNAGIFNCTVGTSNGNYLYLNEGGSTYSIGDLDGVNNGLYDQVDDGNKLYKRISSKTTSSRLLSTSLESLTADRTRTEPDASGTYALVSNLGGTITTPAYGTTVDLSAVTMVTGEIRDVEFNSSTGATGLLLPTGTNAAIGAIVIVGDLLAISLTSNIVVDAGTSNTINAATIAQTQTMNVSGSCWTLKKVTAGKWKLQ